MTTPIEWFLGYHFPYEDDDDFLDDENSDVPQIDYTDLQIKGLHQRILCSWEEIPFVHLYEGEAWLLENIPKSPGIYILMEVNELDCLYVGQSKNLKQRLRAKHLRKTFQAFDLGNVPEERLSILTPQQQRNMRFAFDLIASGYFGDATEFLYIYYKEVDGKDFDTSTEQALVWCESLAIGLLQPILNLAVPSKLRRKGT